MSYHTENPQQSTRYEKSNEPLNNVQNILRTIGVLCVPRNNATD